VCTIRAVPRGRSSSDDPLVVAEVVGATLAALGVDTVFGVVGSGNFVVTNALCAGGARFYAARHESAATSMADGWARVSGRVGVCSVHQGPGLTNTMTALTEAAKARTPVLVLAADTQAGALRSNFRIDQHDLVASVGAIAERVYSAQSAAPDAARALRRAALERRPVVLMLPIDLQTEPVVGFIEGARAVAIALPSAPRPSRAAVQAACDLIAAARHPVIIAGRGAVLAQAREPVESLGRRIGALLATSAMANGLFTGLPYDLGISGGFASSVAAELVAQADLVIGFGVGLNHWTTRDGALIGEHTNVIQVDIEADAIGAHRPVTLGIVGDVGSTAEAIDGELRRRGFSAKGTRDAELEDRIATHRWCDEPYEDAGTERYIDPRTLSIELDRLLPSERTVAVDSGHFLGYPAMYMPVPDARSWVFPNGFQAVGLGFGCAIGAAVAQPQRITVAALGDGGLFMALGELETAVRLGLRLLVVVYDDSAYGAEVHHFGPMGHDTSIVRFPESDLAAIARGAGMRAATVRTVADLAVVSDWCRDGGAGPLLLDAKVNPEICAAWLEEAFRAG
jgi:thiamine pyrophosphate-dependent acetolactate synthase large subunit-like protein